MVAICMWHWFVHVAILAGLVIVLMGRGGLSMVMIRGCRSHTCH